MHYAFNGDLKNRIALAKSLVGKTVYLKGNKNETWQVRGYNNKGYAVLEDGHIQEPKLLRVLEEKENEE